MPPSSASPTGSRWWSDGSQYTYRQLETRIRQTSAALAEAGVGPGDRVALVNLGSALSVATIYAAARLGAATAQMNAYLTPGELGQLAELVGARVGVAGTPYAGGLRSVLDGPVLVEEDVIGADADAAAGSSSTGDGDDTALVLFTSGTTGLPKPIAISHRVVTDRLAFYSKPIDPEADQVVDMMSAPIFHIGGTLGLFISLHQGKQLVLHAQVRRRNLAGPGRALPGGPDVRGADHAAAHPRSPAVRHHRPQLAAGAELRGGGRPGRPHPPGGGRPARRGLLEHLRTDRDARRLRRPDPGGPPSWRPAQLGRPATGRRRRQDRRPVVRGGGGARFRR